ncbi:MAG: cytochrome C [Betaproteobacteria bacterium]|nr:MAG: cytochrome C [Betaproteobacteria bacterium]
MKPIATLSLSLLITAFATPAAVIAAEPAKPLALRGIMQDLGRHMQTITLAIAHEDWAGVEKTAPLIAAHPQSPLSEKTRILSFIGTNLGKFKAHDHKTHEAAHHLMHAAQHQDGPAVISAFQSLQSGCLGCHQEFRKPFIQHFYGAK